MTENQTVLASENDEKKDNVKIEREPTKSHFMDVGPGCLAVDLPCGYIDGEGKLYQQMIVKEMGGDEEELLVGKGDIVSRLNQIITNCTTRFGEYVERADISKAVSSMTAGDRMTVMIALRRISLGDIYDMRIKCPNSECQKINSFNVNLAEIEIVEMDDPMKREREDQLSSGRVVNWHVMSADDEAWLSRMKKKKEKVLSLAMLARIDKIDDVELDRTSKKGYRQSIDYLTKKLTMKERQEIRALFEGVGGTVDTDVEFDCPDCGYEWSADMEVGQASFFFPSAAK